MPAAEPLMRAVAILRAIDTSGAPLPKDPPTGFIKRRWRRYVFAGGAIDRRYYELCVLAELRDRLCAGDVWVTGSRQYRSLEEHLLSPGAFYQLQQKAPLPLAIDTDIDRFLAQRRDLLDSRLAAMDDKAAAGALVDVTITKGVLKVARLVKYVPSEAITLTERLYGMLPRVRITDLLAEVDAWTGFTDSFTHLRTGEAADDRRLIMTGVLADGLNLGLTRMAETCRGVSLAKLAWMADWHIREENFAGALARLVDHQNRQPLAAHFGSGLISSSDGQFFQAGGFGRDAGTVNAHYSREPGMKFYTHVSDRFEAFHTKVISATAGEVPHVLDGLLHRMAGREEGTALVHHTDGGGASDHVFALCTLLGFRFAPDSRSEGAQDLQLLGSCHLPDPRPLNRRQD